MCIEVIVGDKVCRTKAELRVAIGGEPIKDSRYDSWPDDACLCRCAVKATAAYFGYVMATNGVDIEFMWGCGDGVLPR